MKIVLSNASSQHQPLADLSWVGRFVAVGLKGHCPHCRGEIDLAHLPIRHVCPRPVSGEIPNQIRTIIRPDGLVIMIGGVGKLAPIIDSLIATFGLRRVVGIEVRGG